MARAEGPTYPAARGELETALIPQRPRSAKKPPRGAASLVSDIRISTLRSTRAPLSMRAADSFESSSLLLQSEGRSFSGGHEATAIGMHESRCQRVVSFQPTPKRRKHAFGIPAGRRTMSFWPVPKLVPLGKDVCSRRTMSFGSIPKPLDPISIHGLAFYSGTARKNRLRASTTLRIAASYKSPRASIPAPAAVSSPILARPSRE